MDEEIKASLTESKSWLRGLYMLLFAVIYWVAETVLAAVAIIQFIFLLIAHGPNERLRDFGDDLSVYFYQIVSFLTFNTEDKPFPFEPWPSGSDKRSLRTSAKSGTGPATDDKTNQQSQ